MARVVVAGSINMDLVAFAPRSPVPGETLSGATFGSFPGGKGANQAVAASKLGVPTALVGRIGDDLFAPPLEEFLRGHPLDLRGVARVPGVATGVALIVVVAGGQNTIVVAAGANAAVPPEAVQRLTASPGDMFVSQLEIPLETVRAFLAHGRSLGARTVLNAAPAVPCPADLLALADLLVVNELELAFYAGQGDLATDAAIAAAARGLQSSPAQTVVVTLGAAGALALEGDRLLRVPGRPVTAVDTTGAGDCFVGAMAAWLARGFPLEPALRAANLAASLAVQRAGAGPAMPRLEEVEAALAGGG